MSVVNARDLVVDSCEFVGTAGTSPAAGVDFEPNHPSDSLHNITVRNSLIAGNVGGGIVVSISALTSRTPLPVMITFSNCQLPGDAGGAAFRMYWSNETGADPPTGRVLFQGGAIRNAVDAAVNICTCTGCLCVFFLAETASFLKLQTARPP